MATKPIQQKLREDVAALVRQNVSSQSIARQLGCSLSVVYKIIKELGLADTRRANLAATIKLGMRLGFSLRALAQYLDISLAFCHRLSQRDAIPKTARPDLKIHTKQKIEDNDGRLIEIAHYDAKPIGLDEVFLSRNESSHFVQLRSLIGKVEL